MQNIQDGALVIHDSTFDANTASYVSGGVMVSRIFLIFFHARAGDIQLEKGGAICAYYGVVEIRTSTFRINSASEVRAVMSVLRSFFDFSAPIIPGAHHIQPIG